VNKHKISTKTINDNKQTCLSHPQSKMTHCPQCGERYNTEVGDASWAHYKRTFPQNLNGRRCPENHN
jgi:hypothetical protein